MRDNRCHAQDESLGVVLDINCKDLLWQTPGVNLVLRVGPRVVQICVVQVVNDQLRTEIDVWLDSIWACSRFWAIRAVKSKRQQRLPGVLECLAHGALDAIVIKPNHLLDVVPLEVLVTLGDLVPLKAVKMESMTALGKCDASLVLLINDISHLQVFHHCRVPLVMRVFLDSKGASSLTH